MSIEQTSALLHDYCGFVESPVNTHLDKCEQTYFTYASVNQATQTCEAGASLKPAMISVSTQTESNLKIPGGKVSVGIRALKPDLTFEDIQHSDELCMFYTGLPNASTFHMIFDELSDAEEHTKRSGNIENQGRPRILRLVDELFLVLMRLRLGLLLQDLAQRFHISKSTCSNITNHWITYLSVKLSSLTPWIDKQNIIETMPRKFEKYPDCRVIIDCTEIYTETPQSLANKSLMYSNYKSHMTYKALLGISPSGVITFSSDLWAGSVSDKQLTLRSGLLDLCEKGDAIMADKGFLISDLTTPREIKLIIPPLKYQRFNRRQVEETRRIANLRIDVERAMERVKNFRILQGVMPITLSHQVSQIWKICVSLSNLLPPLVHDD